jgi:hypothetical protein
MFSGPTNMYGFQLSFFENLEVYVHYSVLTQSLNTITFKISTNFESAGFLFMLHVICLNDEKSFRISS